MTKEPGFALLDLPFAGIGPQGGQLMIGESGPHADPGIVARNAVASNQTEQRGSKMGPRPSSRFAGDKQNAACCHCLQQLPQRLALEMVKKQIGDDRHPLVVRGPSQPLENVGFNYGCFDFRISKGGQSARAYDGLAIDENYFFKARKIMTEHACEQCSVACPQIDDAPN